MISNGYGFFFEKKNGYGFFPVSEAELEQVLPML